MPDSSHPFDETYFKRAAYANVSFDRFSQYWWSNRYYAGLARQHGEGCGHARLARPAFSADDDDFFHAQAPSGRLVMMRAAK